MSDRGQRGRGQHRGGLPGRGAPGGPRGRGGPIAAEGQGRGRSTGEPRGGSPGFDRGRGGPGFDRGRGEPGFDRGRGGPGFDRGRGLPSSERGRGGPGFDRGRGESGLDRERGGPGFGRGRGGPSFDRGRGGVRGFDRGRGQGDGPGSGPGGFSGSVIYAENTPAKLPDRLADDSQQKLIASFGSLKIQHDRPLRPGYGTLGRPITLRANFFPIRLPKGPIYDYTVEITPKTDINRLKSRIFQLLEMSPLCQPHLPYIAHDHSKRIVSGHKLPQPLEIQVPFYEVTEPGPDAGPDVYNVSIRFFREIDTQQLTSYLDGRAKSRDYDTLPLISALNLVLQQHASRQGIRVGNSRYFFPTAEDKVSLGPRVDGWKGFFLSVRPTFKQLMLNVNVCMTAFVKPGNLASRLFELQDSTGALPTLPEEMVKSIKVKTKHLGYRKPIKAIGTTSARATNIECQEFGGKVSVEQYFVKKYNWKLHYPVELPVIDIGSKNKNVWVPAEMCDIEPGNAYHGKLNKIETGQMIRYACNPPRVNAEAIVGKGLPILGVSPMQGPIGGFDISIDPTMTVVPGRALPPPKIAYKAGQTVAKNGSWNILNVKFQQGATITAWWVMVVRDGRNTFSGPTDAVLTSFVEEFATKLKNSGVFVPAGIPHLIFSPTPPVSDPRRRQALKTLQASLEEELKTQKKPSFILVLLENWDNYIYPGIKRICDVELGIHTVHMQLEKALPSEKTPANERKQDQYFSNVALKVNTKLGGMNHLLEPNDMKWLTKEKTMMVGIDVTHPGPGSREGTPSIAAVVANVDDNFVQFPASLRIQHRSKKEMLDELKDMLIERLLLYEKKNKGLPTRIFVYRDGVSEGQYDTVLKEELAQILEAFKQLSTKARGSYRPSLSIIICGKRHHARFYPTNSQYADKNGNTRPGTVVDKGVTGVFDFDFYLQAHAGLQGSVKATHYIVVYDENNLTADLVQQGTHTASYLYARATKAVSLIPAAYYADLACERGRCYLNDFLVDNKPSTVGKGKPIDKEKEAARVFKLAEVAWGKGLHDDMRESMFYI